MKIILFICLTFLGFNLSAQTKIEKGSYEFTTNVAENFSSLIKQGSNKELEITKGSKITVIGISDDLKKVHIKYWNYPLKLKDKKSFLSKSTLKDNPKANEFNGSIFELPFEFFKEVTQPIYKRYKGTNVGVYTIPFRLRGNGNDFDFESSLSLQANLVAGFGKRTMESSWIDFSLGLGLTGINLNSNNSNITEQRTASAFTVSSGLVVKPSRFTNVGLFIGWDNLGVNDRNIDWVHNGNLWLGLGINVSFNAITTNQSATGKNK